VATQDMVRRLLFRVRCPLRAFTRPVFTLIVAPSVQGSKLVGNLLAIVGVGAPVALIISSTTEACKLTFNFTFPRGLINSTRMIVMIK
jgi:hypothetical protein